MSIVKYSKCHKCGKSLNISELIGNDTGIGKMCSNIVDCKNRLKNNEHEANERKTNEE